MCMHLNVKRLGVQGTVQGALYGARALAQGIGPLIFAWMFAAFTKGSYGLPVFPGMACLRITPHCATELAAFVLVLLHGQLQAC